MSTESLSVFNMSSEDIHWYETNRLYPSDRDNYCSSTGFLKQGESLLVVVKLDRQTLEEYGVSYKDISNKIQEITRRNSSGYASDNLYVYVEATCGYQYCPFSPKERGGSCGSTTVHYIITNEKNGRRITISGLMAHLIESHNFFEGDVEYRTPPKDLIEILEIQTNPKIKDKDLQEKDDCVCIIF